MMSEQTVKNFVKIVYLIGDFKFDENTYEVISEKTTEEVVEEIKEVFKKDNKFELLEYFTFRVIFMEMNGVKFTSEPVDIVHQVLVSKEEIEKRMVEADKAFVQKVLNTIETFAQEEDSNGEDDGLEEVVDQTRNLPSKRVLH
jgi:hypothetical protein